MESSIEVLDLTGDTALVTTKDRYRAIIHDKDGDRIHDELMTFDEAHAFCQSFNTCGGRGNGSWAEFIDYRTAKQREENDQYFADIDDHVERRMAKRKPGVVRRALSQAAAMIW